MAPTWGRFRLVVNCDRLSQLFLMLIKHLNSIDNGNDVSGPKSGKTPNLSFSCSQLNKWQFCTDNFYDNFELKIRESDNNLRSKWVIKSLISTCKFIAFLCFRP